ncbi:autophagy-related protein 17 [Tuber indicum]|nr:autophagy-related protein 17 [Tuber indicum]
MSPSSPPPPSLPVSASEAAAGAVGAPPQSVDLTNWFLDAKRSLASVALCARANSLVDSARGALQEAAIVSSKCLFLRNTLQDQLLVVIRVNRMMHSVREASKSDFEKIVADLDNADARLNQTLGVLRKSVVDPAFNPPGNPEREESTPMATKPRTLHDFVDDEGIENLKSRLRHLIDQVQESHDALLTSLTEFDGDISELDTTINNLTEFASNNSQGGRITSESIRPQIHALEEQAGAMAGLLEALTQHYDRCSEALKQSEPTTNHNQEGGMMGMAESMSPEEKQEMYRVLEKDAMEVDDVVTELKERYNDMENIQSHVLGQLEELNMLRHNTYATFALFEQFQTNLGSYVERMREFETQQEGYARGMEDRLDELWQLGEFYEGFISAYDAMVIEVGRRKGVSVRMETIIRDAMKKLQVLYDDDLADREAFKEEQGHLLPVDIWPGVMDPPIRYSVVKDTNGASELPGISKEVIEQALARQQQQGKGGM